MTESEPGTGVLYAVDSWPDYMSRVVAVVVVVVVVKLYS